MGPGGNGLAGHAASSGCIALVAVEHRQVALRHRHITPALGVIGHLVGARLLQAQVLARLAEVQGVPGKAHVGEMAAAKTNLERADRLLIGLTGQRPDDWAWRRDLGRVRYLLALVAGARDNDPARELTLAREAEQQLQRALDRAIAAHPTPRERAEIEVLLTSARLTQSDAHKARNEHAPAAEIQQREEARLLALPEPVRAAMEFEYQSGRPAMLLGDSLYYLDRRDEALAAYRRATARFAEGLRRSSR